MPRPRTPVAPSERLSQFRGSRQPLPIGDKRVLAVLIIHLVFLSWSLAGMYLWSEITSLVLAVVGFAVALFAPGSPRPETGNLRPEMSEPSGLRSPASGFPPRPPVSRLLRFPLFWLGLALLGYLCLQAANPSWRYVNNGSYWWLVRIPDNPWLPTSVDSPFTRFNVWTQFVVYSSVWLMLCTVWIGLTRRRSFVVLLTTLAANALLIAIVGLAFRLRGTPEYLLWFDFHRKGAITFAGFVYKNHAGAYLSLMAAVMLFLAARYRERALREHSTSSPALLPVLGALLLFFAVVFTFSRAGTLVLAAYLVGAGLAFALYRYLTGEQSATPRIVTFTIAAMVAFVVVFALAQVDFKRVESQFEKLTSTEKTDVSVSQRLEAYEAGRDLLAYTWPRGLGAGGFQYLFPEFIKRFPNSYRGGKLFWEHAHNDYLEIPIELGLAGVVLILAGVGWWCWRLVRTAIWRRLATLLLALGLIQMLLHASVDYLFQSPTLLMTWLVLALTVARFGDRQIEG